MSTIDVVTAADFAQAVGRFLQQPGIRGNLDLLTRRLPDAADIYVVGGALRNIIIDRVHGKAPLTRDVDVFIGGLDRGFDLAAILRDQKVAPTDLKGIRWYPASSPLAYDICLLPDFLVIDAYRLDPNLVNLLRSVDFTINAIVYDIRRRKLFEMGCTAAVRQRRIDFNCRLIPDKRLIAYRIFLMAHKTGFELARPVFQFVKQQLELESVSEVRRIVRAKTERATAAAVMALYDELGRCPSFEAYLARRFRPRGSSA